MRLIDFDILLAEIENKDLEEILKDIYIKDDEYYMNINEALQDDETYKIFEKIGICDFIMKLYKKTVKLAGRQMFYYESSVNNS